jgi:uncharacterized protein (TIGR02246 family)
MGKQRNRWRLALVSIVGVIALAVTGLVTLANADTAGAGDTTSTDGHDVTPSPTERQAVLALWARQFDAWERNDGRDYGDLFTPDGEMVVFDGTRVATRDGIADYMQFVFEQFLQGTRLSAEVESMRKIAPRTIVMISIGCVLRPGETVCPAPALSRQTNVVVERHNQWLFSSFQNTRVTTG